MNPGCQISVSTHTVSCAAAVDAVGWVAKEDPSAGDARELSVSSRHGWLTASTSCPYSSKKKSWLGLEEEGSSFSFREVLEQNCKLRAGKCPVHGRDVRNQCLIYG